MDEFLRDLRRAVTLGGGFGCGLLILFAVCLLMLIMGLLIWAAVTD